MGGVGQKALLTVGGEPVALRSARALLGAASVRGLVVVARGEDRVALAEALAPVAARVLAWADGGVERVDSVRSGVAAAPADAALLLVHDAARCLVRAEQVEAVIEAARQHGAALLATRVRDTIKRAGDGAKVAATLPRAELWAAATPQAARAAPLRAALARAAAEGFVPTDDAALLERYGGVDAVWLVEGDDHNLKLTSPADVIAAEVLLARRDTGRADEPRPPSPSAQRASATTTMNDLDRLRVGLGYDVHRLAPGRRCVLGGVELDHPRGPEGHSDGDAVLHALIDALTGAAGLDDVGSLFPDDDPRYAGADSARLVEAVMERVRAAGFRVVNVDAVLIGDEPKLRQHRAAMRARIAELLGVDATRVNIKGKTTERLGSLAGGAGIAVHATCLLVRA